MPVRRNDVRHKRNVGDSENCGRSLRDRLFLPARQDRCPQTQYGYGSDDQEGRHEDGRRKQLHQQIVYNRYDLVKALAITSISDTVTFCKEEDSVQSKFSLSFPIGNKGSKVICTLYPCNVV